MKNTQRKERIQATRPRLHLSTSQRNALARRAKNDGIPAGDVIRDLIQEHLV